MKNWLGSEIPLLFANGDALRHLLQMIAIEACEAAAKAVGQSQWALAIPGVAYAKAGKAEETQKLLEELHTLSNSTYVSPAAFTWMYCNLGEIEKGMEWFERAIDQHDLLTLASYLFPICDPLRTHPRYKALLKKMNLNLFPAPQNKNPRSFD